MKNVLIVLSIVILLAGGAWYYFQSNEEQEFNDSGRAKAIEDETDLWQFYNDDKSGLSFKYPHNAVLQGGLDDDLSLNVVVTKIDDLEYPGFGKEEALKNMESLSKGEYGKEFDWPIEISKKVTKVSNSNAQEFMALGRFEVCDVVFERKLIFYNNNHQIEITLRGDKDKIVESMPQYFKTDSENCQDDKIWDFDKQAQFYQDLFDGKGSVVAQDWFDTFNEIIKTVYLVDLSTGADLLQGKWTSIDDEDSVIEFRDDIKIDFYAGEEMSQGAFELKNDNQYLTVIVDNEVFEYSIVELTDNILTLTYLPRGNTLKYKR